MTRPMGAALSLLLAVPALAAEPAKAAPPAPDLSAAEVAAALEAQGIKAPPELVARVLPAVRSAVAQRLALEDAVARAPRELAASLDRDPRKDGEAMRRVLDALLARRQLDTLDLATDGRWKVFVAKDAPKGWNLPGYGDANWKAAIDQGPFGVDPWKRAAVGFPATPVARWIWHYASQTGNDFDTAYFRKVFVARSSEPMLYLSADNEFWAFLDGQPVGHGDDWQKVQAIPLRLTPGKTHVLAVKVVNKGGPGALMAETR